MPEISYKTASVERRNIVGRVTASGTLSAIVTVQVGTQVSGRIQKLFADFNSVVTKGELVAKIDPALFDASVQQAQANYLAAKAGVTTAEANALAADKQYARTKGAPRPEPGGSSRIWTRPRQTSLRRIRRSKPPRLPSRNRLRPYIRPKSICRTRASSRRSTGS